MCFREEERGEEKQWEVVAMAIMTMKELLEAGVHFGHQTKRWNPKMKEYIYTERNGIHIFDLRITITKMTEAYNFVSNLAKEEKTVIFVGTKKAAQDIVKEEAERCGMMYVNQRWVGGLLTNFSTIKTRVSRLNELEKLVAEGYLDSIPIKERVSVEREFAKLRKLFEGVKNITSLPAAIFVTDTHKERSAILEARRLHIPVIGIVDSNSDPEEMNYPLPGNDDAIRSIRLFSSIIANAVIEGKEGRVEEERQEKAKSEEENIDSTEEIEEELDEEVSK